MIAKEPYDPDLLNSSPLEDMPMRNYRFANETGRLDGDNDAAIGNYTFSGWKAWGNTIQSADASAGLITENDDKCQPRTMMLSVIASGGRGTNSDLLL